MTALLGASFSMNASAQVPDVTGRGAIEGAAQSGASSQIGQAANASVEATLNSNTRVGGNATAQPIVQNQGDTLGGRLGTNAGISTNSAVQSTNNAGLSTNNAGQSTNNAGLTTNTGGQIGVNGGQSTNGGWVQGQSTTQVQGGVNNSNGFRPSPAPSGYDGSTGYSSNGYNQQGMTSTYQGVQGIVGDQVQMGSTNSSYQSGSVQDCYCQTNHSVEYTNGRNRQGRKVSRRGLFR